MIIVRPVVSMGDIRLLTEQRSRLRMPRPSPVSGVIIGLVTANVRASSSIITTSEERLPRGPRVSRASPIISAGL